MIFQESVIPEALASPRCGARQFLVIQKEKRYVKKLPCCREETHKQNHSKAMWHFKSSLSNSIEALRME